MTELGSARVSVSPRPAVACARHAATDESSGGRRGPSPGAAARCRARRRGARRPNLWTAATTNWNGPCARRFKRRGMRPRCESYAWSAPRRGGQSARVHRRVESGRFILAGTTPRRWRPRRSAPAANATWRSTATRRATSFDRGAKLAAARRARPPGAAPRSAELVRLLAARSGRAAPCGVNSSRPSTRGAARSRARTVWCRGSPRELDGIGSPEPCTPFSPKRMNLRGAVRVPRPPSEIDRVGAEGGGDAGGLSRRDVSIAVVVAGLGALTLAFTVIVWFCGPVAAMASRSRVSPPRLVSYWPLASSPRGSFTRGAIVAAAVVLARERHLSVLEACAPPQRRPAARGKADSHIYIRQQTVAGPTPDKAKAKRIKKPRSRVTGIVKRPSNATQMAQQTPTSNSVKALRARGDQVWARMPKCNAEFFRLTYGALVVQLVEDCDDIKEVNDKLLSMGVSIGTRIIIDEFLAKSNQREPCKSFEETCEVVGRVAFKMFLGSRRMLELECSDKRGVRWSSPRTP